MSKINPLYGANIATSLSNMDQRCINYIKPGTKIEYLGYLAKTLPDGRKIDYNNLKCFPEYDGWGIYDDKNETVYLIS